MTQVSCMDFDGSELGSGDSDLPSEDAMTKSAAAFIAERRPMVNPSSTVIVGRAIYQLRPHDTSFNDEVWM